MSDSIDNKEVQPQTEQETTNQPEATQEEGFVPKKAFQEVSSDMHKYKNQLREKEAMLNQLLAEKELQEKQALEEQGRWKELYEKTQNQLEEVNTTRQAEQDKFINHHKKNAVLREIGGFKKDEYSNFINIENVIMDENGNIDRASLDAEVSRLKQEMPELLKNVPGNSLPSNAPMNTEVKQEMSKSELKAKLLADYKKNNNIK